MKTTIQKTIDTRVSVGADTLSPQDVQANVERLAADLSCEAAALMQRMIEGVTASEWRDSDTHPARITIERLQRAARILAGMEN